MNCFEDSRRVSGAVWMCGCADERMGGYADGWIGGYVDGWMCGCFSLGVALV